jgi:hypothetical protein
MKTGVADPQKWNAFNDVMNALQNMNATFLTFNELIKCKM